MSDISPKYTYRCRYRSAYDADTIRVDIDCGFGVWLTNQPLRLWGINAPEMRGAEKEQGKISRDWLRNRLVNADKIIIKTLKDGKGKYGRLLAIVYADGININETLVNEGYAVEYMRDSK